MKRNIKAVLAAFAALDLSLALCGTALGGGATLDEDDNHPYYFGSVKDTNGTAIVNAKVKIQTKTLTIMTQSNDLGAYKLPIVGTVAKPDDVTFTCSKDGYRQADVIWRSGAGGDGKDPVEIDCTLQHE